MSSDSGQHDTIQVQYDALSRVASTFADHASVADQTLRRLVDCMAALEHGGWEGDNARVFFKSMNNEVYPGLQRLSAALKMAGTTMQQISKLFSDAELAAAAELKATGQSMGLPGAGGPGWEQVIIGGRPVWKFVGDVLSLVGPGRKALVALGILSGNPELSIGAQLGVMAGQSAFTYLEYYGQEPDPFRGGAIAIGNTLIGEALDLNPYTGTIEALNSVWQVGGTLAAAEGYAQSYMMNLDPRVSDALRANSQRLYDVVDQTDIGDFNYEASRLGFDLLTAGTAWLQPEYRDAVASQTPSILSRDWGRAMDRVAEFGTGLWNAPDAVFDYGVTRAVAGVDNWVNSRGFPPALKSSCNDFSAGVVNYVNTTGMVDVGLDVLPQPIHDFFTDH